MIVRPHCSEDIPALLAINEAATPGVNSLSESALSDLLANALLVRVVADDTGIAGFILCLGEGLSYSSDNYRWFSAHYEHFAYIDRIAIADGYRGQGLGGHLYDALETALAGSRRVLLCEVNEDPPNPGSQRFHRNRGFTPVGRQATDGGTKPVVLMAKPLNERS